MDFILVILTIVMLCDMFSNEYDSSFAAILRLSKKGGLKTFYSKYLLSFILSTFSYFFFSIIDIAFLFTYYGVDYLNVGIMSIPLFSSTNMDINILGYLILYKSISYIGILILSSLITSISSINKKLPLSIAINIVILFIPYILSAFEITAEELFATNRYKDSQELLKMINKNIAQIGDNSEKLEIIYNLTKSLTAK